MKCPPVCLFSGLASVLWASLPTTADVVLNEVMANNQTAVADGPSYPDYVELLNPSAAAVNLGGWSLTDDPSQPRRFVFPALSVPAGGRLLVWCSATATTSGLNAGFGLGAGGDQILLLGPDAQIRDQLAFGFQAEDLPSGRIPDGSGPWTLIRPSPLAANEAMSVAPAPTVRINEWLARPAQGEDWLELYNLEEEPADLSGWILTDSLSAIPSNQPIPALSFLGPKQFLQLFASDLKEPFANHLDFKLGAGGETLTLLAPNRFTVVNRVTFGSQTDQISQGRVPDGGDSLAFLPTSSPGAPNVALTEQVVINEVLSHTDPPLEDAIELHNPTAQTVDLSHWWVSDSLTEPRKYRIPAGTTVPAGGFLVLFNDQFGRGAQGFSLNSYEGDRVVVSAGNAAGELTGWQTSVRFGATRNGVSLGRVGTSQGSDFVPLAQRTFGVDQPASLAQFRQSTGRTNAAARVGPVVLNELYFRPGAEPDDVEFLEFHNPTSQTVLLYDPESPTNTWRLRDGISFEFSSAVTLPAGGFLLLVNFDPTQAALLSQFRARFQVPATTPILGPFSGRLSDTGEAVELQHPDIPEGPDSTNPGFVPFERLERLEYGVTAPWPLSLPGTSLQRLEPTTYGNEPRNWFSATPTAGRGNEVVSADADEDGQPDDWERTHGLDPADPADAALDSDDDGASNRDEYEAGTNPRDLLSVFRIIQWGPVGSGWELRFSAVAQRSYTLEQHPFVATGPWQALMTLPAVETNGVRSFLWETAPAESLLRIRTSRTP